MKLVVGLGNPGKQYEATKHNIGFMVIDAIADSASHTPWREEQKAEVCSINVAGEKGIACKASNIYECKWRIYRSTNAILQDRSI